MLENRCIIVAFVPQNIYNYGIGATKMNTKLIEKICEINNGYVTDRMLKKNKIPTIVITRLVNKGILFKVARGVYLHKDYPEDQLFTFQLAYSKFIYSKHTALYLNDLSNRRMDKIYVNVPRNYNLNIVPDGVVINRVNDVKYNLGLTILETPFGNKVNSYDKERCICDLFLCDNDLEEIKYALNEYIKGSYNIEKLYSYAKKLKVYERVKQIIELL